MLQLSKQGGARRCAMTAWACRRRVAPGRAAAGGSMGARRSDRPITACTNNRLLLKFRSEVAATRVEAALESARPNAAGELRRVGRGATDVLLRCARHVFAARQWAMRPRADHRRRRRHHLPPAAHPHAAPPLLPLQACRHTQVPPCGACRCCPPPPKSSKRWRPTAPAQMTSS